MKVNFDALKKVLEKSSSKTEMAVDSNVCLREFNALLSNYIYCIHTLKQDEVANIIMSMQHWILKKDVGKCRDSVKVGDIFYAELGNCYKPELAYAHPVVILEEIGGLVLVAPVTTSEEIVKSAYHPINNPEGNKFFRKVGKEDNFDNECAIVLSNIKTISKGRLIEKKGSLKDISNENSLFVEIKLKAFELFFPKQFIQYRNIMDENINLKKQIEELTKNNINKE